MDRSRDGLRASVGTMNFDINSLALNDESTSWFSARAARRSLEEVLLVC